MRQVGGRGRLRTSCPHLHFAVSSCPVNAQACWPDGIETPCDICFLVDAAVRRRGRVAHSGGIALLHLSCAPLILCPTRNASGTTCLSMSLCSLRDAFPYLTFVHFHGATEPVVTTVMGLRHVLATVLTVILGSTVSCRPGVPNSADFMPHTHDVNSHVGGPLRDA
jgi:hypothetical protein